MTKDKPKSKGFSLLSSKNRQPSLLEPSWGGESKSKGLDNRAISPSGELDDNGYFTAGLPPGLSTKDLPGFPANSQNDNPPPVPAKTRTDRANTYQRIAPWGDGPADISPGLTQPNQQFLDECEDPNHPLYRPSTARTNTGDSFEAPWEDRRPSLASAASNQSIENNTAGNRNSHNSTGKSGRAKKLGSLFSNDSSRNSSEKNTPTQSTTSFRNRAGSLKHQGGGGKPETPARPKTPTASSDVAPWEYQEVTDTSNLSKVAPRHAPSRSSEADIKTPQKNGNSHRFHLPGHRHQKSKEKEKEKELPQPKELERDPNSLSRTNTLDPYGGWKPESREGSISQVNRSNTDFAGYSPAASDFNITPRATSPAPGEQRGGGDSSMPKRFFNKIRRPKAEKPAPGGVDQLGELQPPPRTLNSKPSITSFPLKKDREISVATTDSDMTIKPVTTRDTIGSISSVSGRKESKAGFLGLRRGKEKELNKSQTDLANDPSYFSFDTDLNDMSGILAHPTQETHDNDIFTGLPKVGEEPPEPPQPTTPGGGGGWDAPDSWAVKRTEDITMDRLREIGDDGDAPTAEDTGVPHGLRVFRIDSTFATLSTGVNTTVAEVLQILGKKSFLQDDLDTYQIIMRKQDLQRQLAPGERPLAIQKKLLEQAGYKQMDHIEEIGRDDNSHLVRFTFVPTKISGLFNIERDPELNKLFKFKDVDLSGKSLVAIPIALYSRAHEIVNLNISRNLALDVPKDFIQSCTRLRSITFCANEAWKLPLSFSLATKLTYLDISNNYLEQIDHADLDKLHSLISLKLANNKLTSLPSSFHRFTDLRKLNMSSNYMKEVPHFVYGLRSLRDLDISFNEIESLPHVGRLTYLERLVASNNQISGALPDDLCQLRHLREIDLRFNGITNMDVISKLPSLETLYIGDNGISKFEGSFQNLKVLTAERNPITRFHIDDDIYSLCWLDLQDAKITHFEDSIWERIPNVTKLVLDKNQFRALPNQLGYLSKLTHLSMAKNALVTLPQNIGCLQDLEVLDLHENNIRTLPPELWCCTSLKTLILASNVLESLPKLSANLQQPTIEPTIHVNKEEEDDLGDLDDFANRRPSQASSTAIANSPAGTRKGSVVSVNGPQTNRKGSIVSKPTGTEGMAPLTRKDSNIQAKLASTFAGTLTTLSLADNRLDDDIYEIITYCSQLRVLNLSHNGLDDVPRNALRRWPNLQELYLSGNAMSSLPTDDMIHMENHPLRILHINANKFQVLPAELGKIKMLSVLDVGSNNLKYNVTNWRYDWNWNSNPNLKYLNFSGNKRLEIKPHAHGMVPGGYVDMQDLTNFNRLTKLRVIGLMDVTLTIANPPENSDDRRVRSTDSSVGTMTYGMADTLGKQDHLSCVDFMLERFRGRELETLVALFDGQSITTGGSKVAKYLAENFSDTFSEELNLLEATETIEDAMRRTFLALNRDVCMMAFSGYEEKENRKPLFQKKGAGTTLGEADLRAGGVGTVLFLDNMELWVANVGDAEAVLMHSDGRYKVLTEKHIPTSKVERQRIREAGGFVSRSGKLNDQLEVSRAFGYAHLQPALNADPHVTHITLQETDDMIVIASKELWDYITFDVAIDVARSERDQPMFAAQKLRDLAIAFGATGKIVVMVIGVADLKKRERLRKERSSGAAPDDSIASIKRKKKTVGPADSTLARLDSEVDAPEGELSLVFTDIKSSTALWELNSVAMRASIKIHNDLFRRQLRIIGGYEVKTEGDAFMVAFPTASSALLWCFSVQALLLTAPWPKEILESPYGQEIEDEEGNIIYRGLSVRMGAHWGSPVCEPDPITRRMDYFGPMVNRAARIQSVADGGQITVSTDFISEIKRLMESYSEGERKGSSGSEEAMMDDALTLSIRRDLRALATQGYEAKDLGNRKLKGLENPEYLYLMYPHALASRLTSTELRAEVEAAALAALNKNQQEKAETTAEAGAAGAAAGDKAGSPAVLAKTTQFGALKQDCVWDLWALSMRLEMICSALETPGQRALREPDMGTLKRMREKGGEVPDAMLVQFTEHLVARVESAVTTLQLRNMIRPFGTGQNLLLQAADMGTIMTELNSRLAEWREMRESQNHIREVH